MTPSEPIKLWTPEQTADYLGVPPSTLKYWRQEKQGPPYFKVGARIRYHPRQVERYLVGQQRLADVATRRGNQR